MTASNPEVEINNIDIYNKNMAKAIEDKLWMTKLLNMKEFENAVVYDLGCADGELIRHLAPIYPNRTFIGIDIEQAMIELARQRQGFSNEKYINYNELRSSISHDKPVFLIMSSVIHEIWNYQENPKSWLGELIEIMQPDYIFVRDMIYDESLNRFSSKENVNKIYNALGRFDHRIDEFQKNFGTLENQKNLVHFLLKYRYEENWEREVKENYLPMSFDELNNLFGEWNYSLVYHKQYTLPFIKEQVKKDFDIDLMDRTHVNVIFKLNNN